MRKHAIFGGSFNPFHNEHRLIAKELAPLFDLVTIFPSGPRPDKPPTNDIDPLHRAANVDLGARGLPANVRVELSDLERTVFTRNHEFKEIFGEQDEIWHVVGTDLIVGGRNGDSKIQREWQYGRELWENERFVVFVREGFEFDEADLPPHHKVIRLGLSGTSTLVRNKVFSHEPITGLVPPLVEEYIERHELYRGRGSVRTMKLTLAELRLLIYVDPWNEEGLKVAERYREFADEKNPNLILVIGGDGSMLRAIRKYWRLRIPFFGVNKGHKGYLLNGIAENEVIAALRGTLEVTSSPLLYFEATAPDGTKKDGLAFNDAYMKVRVTEEDDDRVGWFEIAINKRIVEPKLEADGVVVSTPAGSTAYVRSAGGVSVLIGEKQLSLVGLNPSRPTAWHNKIQRPDDPEVIRFRNVDHTGWRKTVGFADGAVLGLVNEMKVRFSLIAAAELAWTPEFHPRRKLEREQFPSLKD